MTTNTMAPDGMTPGAPPLGGAAYALGVEPAVYPESGHDTQNHPLAPEEPGADPWYPMGGESDEG